MRKMKAKYAGTCSECGGHVEVGDSVYWQKGSGVKHADEAACADAFDYDAEQRAEMRFEMGCAAHMAGTSYVHREYGFDQL